MPRYALVTVVLQDATKEQQDRFASALEALSWKRRATLSAWSAKWKTGEPASSIVETARRDLAQAAMKAGVTYTAEVAASESEPACIVGSRGTATLSLTN